MQALDPCLRIKETSSELFSVSYYKKTPYSYLVCSIEGKKTTEGKETIDITQDEPDITPQRDETFVTLSAYSQ